MAAAHTGTNFLGGLAVRQGKGGKQLLVSDSGENAVLLLQRP